jgi:(p)ppGpp synthase/HD superfamily hydrolase
VSEKCPEEQLAHEWMIGYRQGPQDGKRRFAWEHPQDLVNLLKELPELSGEPGVGPEPNFIGYRYMTRVAWLHDIIEDGVIGVEERSVTPNDLEDCGIHGVVIAGVVALTQKPTEDKTTYLSRLHKAPWTVRLVKCVDRICNLREGSQCFKDKRWARYVKETREYIIPLTQDLAEPHREWAVRLLEEAIALRPVVEVP